MLKLCGSAGATHVTREGLLANECFLDGLSNLGHFLFILVTIPVLIVFNKSHDKGIYARSWVHFPAHELRWIFNLLLILLNFTEITEGILSDSHNIKSHLHLYLPHCISVLGSVLALVYYHHIETGWNSPKFLLMLMFYWSFTLMMEILKLTHLILEEVTMDMLRLHLESLAVGIYSVLLLIEVYVWIRLRYAFLGRPVLLKPANELQSLAYIDSYANPLSKATFYWVRSLVHGGYKQPIQRQELGTLPEEGYPSNIRRELREIAKGKTVSMKTLFCELLERRVILAGGFKLLGDLLGFVPPLSLGFIPAQLAYYNNNNNNNNNNDTTTTTTTTTAAATTLTVLFHSVNNSVTSTEGTHDYVSISKFFGDATILSIFLFLVMVLQTVFQHAYYHMSVQHGIQVRAALQMVVYEKLVRTSMFSLKNNVVTVPKVKYLLTDAGDHVLMLCGMLHEMWALPLRVLLVMGLLYWLLGSTAFLALVAIIVFVILQCIAMRIFAVVHTRTMNITKTRLDKCHEFLRKIKPLKMNAYEEFFSERINSMRKLEICSQLKGALISVLMKAVIFAGPLFLAAVCFSADYYMNYVVVTAGKAFMCIALLETLAQPLHLVPFLIGTLREVRQSSCELFNFLQTEGVISLTRRHARTKRSSGTSEFQDGTSVSGVRASFYLETMQSDISLTTPTSEGPPTPEFPALGVIPEESQPMLPGSKVSPAPKRKQEESSQDQAKPTTGSGGGTQPGESVSPRQPRKSSSTKPAPPFHSKSWSASPSSAGGGAGDPVVVRPGKGSGMPKKRPQSEGGLPLLAENIQLKELSRQRFAGGSTSPVSPEPRRHMSTDTTASGDTSVSSGKPVRAPGVILEIDGGCFAWSPLATEPDLTNLDLQFESGKLSLVLGAPNSGKSMLLAAMLGEMKTLGGAVHWRSGATVALVSQKPWILNTSLRGNILFGKAMDQKRYKQVLRTCALNADVGLLPAGDQTMIGEKGLVLSEGQKQRVCFARALYSSADVILLDNSLAILDPSVARHIVEHGFVKFLLKQKRTIILASTSTRCLKMAHKIVYMENGCIKYDASLEEIKKVDPALVEFWIAQLSKALPGKVVTSDNRLTSAERQQLVHQVATMEYQRTTSEVPTSESLVDEVVNVSPRLAFTQRCLLPLPMPYTKCFPTQYITKSLACREKQQHIDPQGVQEGGADNPLSEVLQDYPYDHVGEYEKQISNPSQKVVYQAVLRSWWLYIRASFIPFTFLLITILCLRITFFVIADVAIFNFPPEENTANQSMVTASGEDDDYMCWYLMMAGIAIGTCVLVPLISELVGIYAGMQLHSWLLKSLTRASLKIFDLNPTDLIMRRFAADISTIDNHIPASIEGVCRTSFLCIAAIVIACLATPFILILGIFVFVIVYLLQQYSCRAYRRLRHLDNICEPQLLEHMYETLAGLPVIRATGNEKRYRTKTQILIEARTMTSLWLHAVNRWLHLRLDILGAFIAYGMIMAAIISYMWGYCSMSIVYIVILYGIWVFHNLSGSVRWKNELAWQMHSVGRLMYFVNEPNDPRYQVACAVPADWPCQGKIEFRDVSLRYDVVLEPTVEELTFTIMPGQKVGICGTLGSGKSTLVLGLLNMLDICQGQILVDDIDITEVPTKALRSSIRAIPQEPNLYNGTVRFNLDLMGNSSEDQLWFALDMVGLKERVVQLDHALDTNVLKPTGEEIFNLEEKQFFAIAQAYLRKTSIVILDEPITSVSIETWKKMKELMHSGLKQKTVLVLATFFKEVSYLDMVVLMKDGRVVEVDTPANIMASPDSPFAPFIKPE